MKEYLYCKVVKHDGTIFNNPLKLSEAYMVSTLCRENREVVIRRVKIPKSLYNAQFNPIIKTK